MAGIQTITISGNNYQANTSVAVADAYLAVDPVRAAAWAAKNTDQKGGLLVAATRRLDLLPWKGEKAGGASQTTAFPRTGLSYPDGTPIPDTDVPQEVINATCLLAGTLAITPSASQAGTSGSNKKKVKAGSAEVEYFRPTSGVQLQDETAYAMILFLLTSSEAMTSASSGQMASGTCERSSFSCPDMGYKLTDGYP